MVDVRKVRGGKAQAAMARAAVRKALAFSPPPVATVSPASDEDVVSAASTTFSSAVSVGNPQEVLASEEEEVGRSTSSFGCSSPPPASTIITTEIGSYSSATSRSADAAVDTEPLMRACSAVASSSVDGLSRKVAAALLKALEHDAAVSAGGGGRGDGWRDALSNRVEKVWIAVLCFGVLSVLLALTALAMLASWSGPGEDWSPYPPPT